MMSSCQGKLLKNNEVDLQNKEVSCCSNVHDLDQISCEITKIGQEILRITLIVKNRNIKDINKNFQATLTNYFLECYVCTLLLKHMGLQYKRDVKKRIENILKANSVQSTSQECHQSHQNDISDDNINQTQPKQMEQKESNEDETTTEGEKMSRQNKKIAKYVRLIKAYEDQIKIFKLEDQYIIMLIDKINEDVNCFSKDSQKYVTQYQKKLCALLILQHFLQGRVGNIFRSFCELWNSVFINLPLYYFARENNIFYNKAKMGEEIQEENLKQLMIPSSNKMKEQSSDHNKYPNNKANSEQKQKVGLSGKVAHYKKIEQNPPNISLNYEKMVSNFYENKSKNQKNQNFNAKNNIVFKKEEEEDEESQKNMHKNPKEISIVNLFAETKAKKLKKQHQKKKLLSPPGQILKLDNHLTKLQKLNDPESEISRYNPLKKQQNGEKELKSQRVPIQILDYCTQKQGNKYLNDSLSNFNQQVTSSEFQQENSKKQAKYRFI